MRLRDKLVQRIVLMRDHRGRRRLLNLALQAADGSTIRSRYGPMIRVRSKDRTNRFCITGEYARDYDDVMAEVERLGPGMAFIDIGANLGLFSLVASKRVGSEGIVLAFEPSFDVFADLVHNAAFNGLRNFFPFNAAIGGRTEESRFATGAGDHTGVGHLDENGNARVLSLGKDELVPILDALVQERSVAIKIDVEGAEDMVIRAIIDFASLPTVKTIIVEIDRQYLTRFNSSPEQIYERLNGVGLRPVRGLNFSDHYNEIFVRTTPN